MPSRTAGVWPHGCSRLPPAESPFSLEHPSEPLGLVGVLVGQRHKHGKLVSCSTSIA